MRPSEMQPELIRPVESQEDSGLGFCAGFLKHRSPEKTKQTRDEGRGFWTCHPPDSSAVGVPGHVTSPP